MVPTPNTGVMDAAAAAARVNQCDILSLEQVRELRNFAQCLATVVYSSGAVIYGNDRYYRYPGISTITHMMIAYGIGSDVANSNADDVRDKFAARYRELQDSRLTTG